MFAIPLHRMNKFASIAILPLMVLAIVVFSKPAATKDPLPTPTEGRIVVANLHGESLTIHDLRSGASEELALPGPPHELAVAAGTLFVTLGRANKLAEVDLAGPSLLRLATLEGVPHGLAVSGGNLLVTLDGASAMVTLDPGSLVIIAHQGTGDTPHSIAVAGASAFVTDSRDGKLRNVGSGTTLPTGAMPESVASVGNWLVTADNTAGTLSVFTVEPFAPVGRVQLGGGPVRVIALDDSRVLVALAAAGEVVVIDLKAMKVERRVRVAARPDGLCLSPGGAFVAVASNGTATVQVLRLSDWRPVGSFIAGDGPGACAWLPR